MPGSKDSCAKLICQGSSNLQWADSPRVESVKLSDFLVKLSDVLNLPRVGPVENLLEVQCTARYARGGLGDILDRDHRSSHASLVTSVPLRHQPPLLCYSPWHLLWSTWPTPSARACRGKIPRESPWSSLSPDILVPSIPLPQRPPLLWLAPLPAFLALWGHFPWYPVR